MMPIEVLLFVSFPLKQLLLIYHLVKTGTEPQKQYM